MGDDAMGDEETKATVLEGEMLKELEGVLRGERKQDFVGEAS